MLHGNYRNEKTTKYNEKTGMKISVLTFTYRPGYIDNMTQALRDQTLKDFEWLLIDDLWEQRKDVVRD